MGYLQDSQQYCDNDNQGCLDSRHFTVASGGSHCLVCCRAQGVARLHHPELIPLDDYERPAGPAVNQLENWYQSLRKKLIDRDSEVTVTEDQLSAASIESIRSFTVEPDCSSVFQALDEGYLTWMNSAAPDDHLRLLVFPACDRADRVASWAKRNHMDILDSPDRSELLSRDLVEVVIPPGDGPLVIPRLEQWFIRHRRGLRHIRALLAALQNTSRFCLISCSSWSWVYLKKAVNADLVLPAPQSLAPYNADDLGNWLLALLDEEPGIPVVFRDYDDGKTILCRGEDGSISDNFLQQLAGDSGGIPWIAWQLWRRSLRTESENDSQSADDQEENAEDAVKRKASDDNRKVFWVVRSQAPTLPRGHERAACLLLQALLIHGSLPEHMLCAVIPSIGETHLVEALVRSGFIERQGDEVSCRATAYPVIWTSLANSGMSMAPF